ncbi:ATP-binding protein [Sphingomonas sp. ID0503]|uniref:sensor histidine kinase n=1 Tax=Sphingomonas sp. ID0503 TaxID=3399691 RepID=UPI003AFA0E4A
MTSVEEYGPVRETRRAAVLLAGRTRLMPAIEIGTLLLAVGMSVATYFIVAGTGGQQRLLTPPLVALLLVANLVPLMALMVLVARRVAVKRARDAGGTGRLRVRLVATFSVIASVPTLLVVIFASLLFQYGVEFWFSDRARTVLINSDRVAQAYVEENRQRLSADIVAMGTDVANALISVSVDDPRFSAAFARQVAYRNLSEAAIITIGQDGARRLVVGANLDRRPLERRLPNSALADLAAGTAKTATARDRVEGVIALDPQARAYLYASRQVDPLVLAQVSRARAALNDYNSILDRTRLLQLRFNAALILVSLLIVAAAIWIALVVADRLVRPVGELALAARKVAAGDLSARVSTPPSRDEIGTLAAAFNRMTRRLAEQTGALMSANTLLETRRALTEAVLSGVSAGVISLDQDRRVRLMNSSAAAFLGTEPQAPVGEPLSAVAPELDGLIGDGLARDAVVQITVAGEIRTLAAKIVETAGGHVITFDDITQQLNDQRRAAWADVARRIAHEIKNPLTPIQLAAERLQRRYGKEIQSDPTIFEQLTSTIVRQVGDLRRMVDEFSSFARMPKPVFRPEVVADIARQTVFLHEVAHPAITFGFEAEEGIPPMICDRRQLGQALTNIVKNAVEAVEEKGGGEQSVTVHLSDAESRLVIEVADSGIGLPPDRERLTEPYMTTRAKGTGLGLAIVRKIVEEHCGTLTFADRPEGGTIVRMAFDRAALERLRIADEQEDEDTPAMLARVRS